ncbi:MAG: TerB family tellurite resistance protein [Ilumatobacter sp.]|nr:TerB family tellurite resistance protein [Ilumatobacter sp.]
MGILDMLGVGQATSQPASSPATDTVQRIVSELEALEATQARYLAAFAYVLSRVANADSTICVNETEAMREIVQKLGHLSEAQALLVVEIAKSHTRLLGGTENYLVTREFRDVATETQRLELLDCLFAVAAADGAICSIEESQTAQIAKELGFTQSEYAAALAGHAEHRSVLKSLRQT